MTKTKKELTKAQEFEMFMLGISYKHDNEITLCIDDVWEHIQSLLKQQREEILAAGYDEVSKTYSPDAIFDYLKQGDSADLAGGGFQIGYNQAIDDILRSLKKGETK